MLKAEELHMPLPAECRCLQPSCEQQKAMNQEVGRHQKVHSWARQGGMAAAARLMRPILALVPQMAAGPEERLDS